MDNEKDISINGPINIAIMKGKIGQIQKTLIIFFDEHRNLDRQTKCSNYNNIDVDKYIINLIKTNQNLDFDLFIEQGVHMGIGDNKYKYNYNATKRYIETIWDVLDKEYGIKNNKTIKSKTFENVKFHLIDMRHNIGYFEVMNTNTRFMNEIKNNDQKNIINNLKNYENFMTLFDNVDKEKNKILVKIIKKYKHDDVKNKINKIINKFKTYNGVINGFIKKLKIYCMKYFKTYNAKYEDVFVKYEKMYLHSSNHHYIKCEKYYYNILKYYHLSKENIAVIAAALVDFYFLRRFLDKDYVKNGILYAGGSHCSNVIFLLMKYFNFEISYLDYCKINIEDFTKQILEFDDIYNHDVLSTQIYNKIQCSKIPKNIQNYLIE